jgi:two-component system sensor histidine kinase/response regulator
MPFAMNYKQLHLVKNLNPDQNIDKGKSVDPRSVFLSTTTAVKGKATIADHKLRLLEMEEINTRLEKEAGEQSAKLAEVIATNSKFLSKIAHDLRSPFNSIIGVLELLKDSYDDYDIEHIDKYIRMATNSANGTLNLLDNLLSWTAAQNKATYFNPVRIGIHEMVTEELDEISTSASHKLITLNQSVPPNLFIAADFQMVKTILRNLINNAIKYSFIGGEITVSATEGLQFVEITVEDNGIGITHKAQKELFRENEIHSTRGTNNENGTGLGLILCKGFVEKHGGKISVKSKPGKGTKIKFTLPHYI